jgi:hypothetical protein
MEPAFSTRSDTRKTATQEWDTRHYVTHTNRVTVFCWVRAEATSGEPAGRSKVSTRPEAKNDCAGEAQQQFNRPIDRQESRRCESRL